MRHKKVIIIGAGPAGLTAGYKLLQQSAEYEVVIIEESDVSGGISRTVFHNGNRMDIGGHRFFSKDNAVNAMWDELMPIQGYPSFDDLKLKRNIELNSNGPNPEKTDKVMLLRNRISRIYYKHHFFDYPVKMNFNTICNLGLLTTFTAGISYLKSLLAKKPEISLENFYINRFGYKLYSLFFENYTEKLWGRHPKVISADWGAQRVKGLSILTLFKNIFTQLLPERQRKKCHIETSLIEKFRYPKFGPGQLWEITAKKFEKMGGKIIYNCRAEKFKQNDGKITEIICSRNGAYENLTADIIISSMPLKNLISGINNVPPEIANIASGLPYRDFVTVGLLFKKINLKNKTTFKTLNNIVPDCWIYVQDPGIKLGRIQVFNNWSPYMVNDPENTIWLGLEYFCSENDNFWIKNNDELKNFAAAELTQMGIINADETILDCHVEKIKKAYPAYFDTYKDIDKVIKYLNSFENLYCIGRNGQHRYNNMDHSMVTAFEAVKHIIANDGTDKKAIWNVNTEKEYHEEQKSK